MLLEHFRRCQPRTLGKEHFQSPAGFSTEGTHVLLANVQDEPRPWLARAVLLGARIVTAMVVGSGALLGIWAFTLLLWWWVELIEERNPQSHFDRPTIFHPGLVSRVFDRGDGRTMKIFVRRLYDFRVLDAAIHIHRKLNDHFAFDAFSTHLERVLRPRHTYRDRVLIESKLRQFHEGRRGLRCWICYRSADRQQTAQKKVRFHLDSLLGVDIRGQMDRA